jgi:hypothetical protein
VERSVIRDQFHFDVRKHACTTIKEGTSTSGAPICLSLNHIVCSPLHLKASIGEVLLSPSDSNDLQLSLSLSF